MDTRAIMLNYILLVFNETGPFGLNVILHLLHAHDAARAPLCTLHVMGVILTIHLFLYEINPLAPFACVGIGLSIQMSSKKLNFFDDNFCHFTFIVNQSRYDVAG